MRRDIRSSGLRPAPRPLAPAPQSGLVIALTSLKADPRACINNPFILAELERLDFIQQSPWANAITLKGEAFLNDLSAPH